MYIFTQRLEHECSQHFMFNIPNVHQSVNGWTNCGISIKQNTTQLYNSELLIYAATWPHLQIIMVDKRESKDTCYVIPHIWKCRKCKLICRSESRLILPGQRKGGSERIRSPKHKRKHFRMTERFIILVLQVQTLRKNTIVHLNKCTADWDKCSERVCFNHCIVTQLDKHTCTIQCLIECSKYIYFSDCTIAYSSKCTEFTLVKLKFYTHL